MTESLQNKKQGAKSSKIEAGGDKKHVYFFILPKIQNVHLVKIDDMHRNPLNEIFLQQKSKCKIKTYSQYKYMYKIHNFHQCRLKVYYKN